MEFERESINARVRTQSMNMDMRVDQALSSAPLDALQPEVCIDVYVCMCMYLCIFPKMRLFINHHQCLSYFQCINIYIYVYHNNTANQGAWCGSHHAFPETIREGLFFTADTNMRCLFTHGLRALDI